MHNIAQCTSEHEPTRRLSAGRLGWWGAGQPIIGSSSSLALHTYVLSANVHFSVNAIVLVHALDTTSSMSGKMSMSTTSPDLTATSTSGITSFSTLTGLQWLAPLPSYYGLCPFFSSLFLLRFEGKITRINISKKILMGRKTRSGPDSGNLRKVLEPTFS